MKCEMSQSKADDRKRYLTVVFERSDGKFPNPFKVENPFGECVSAGLGDIMNCEFMLTEAAQYAIERRDINWLRRWLEEDPDCHNELEKYIASLTPPSLPATPASHSDTEPR